MTILEKISAWARRIKRDATTLWFACKHAGTPWYAKALCALTVAYALSPIDLIPDSSRCWVMSTTRSCCPE